MAHGVAAVAAGACRVHGFELRYLRVDRSGVVECQGALAACWNVRFEDVPPVRRFPSYKGQRNFPGLYFAACMGRHVGFESWLERDQLMMLDFSLRVRSFAAQPFWLLWESGGRARRHAPDFFVRLADGGGELYLCGHCTNQLRPALSAQGWAIRLIATPAVTPPEPSPPGKPRDPSHSPQ